MQSLSRQLRTIATVVAFSSLTLPSAFGNQEIEASEESPSKPLTTIIENDAAFQKTLANVNKTVEEQTLSALKLSDQAFNAYKSFKQQYPTATRPDYEKNKGEIVELIKTIRASFLKLDYQQVQNDTNTLQIKVSDFLKTLNKDLETAKSLQELSTKVEKLQGGFKQHGYELPAEVTEVVGSLETAKASFNIGNYSAKQISDLAKLIEDAPTADGILMKTVGKVAGGLALAIGTGYGIYVFAPQIRDEYRSWKEESNREEEELGVLTNTHKTRIEELRINLEAISSVLEQNPKKNEASETDKFCPLSVRHKLENLVDLLQLAINQYQKEFESAANGGLATLKAFNNRLSQHPLTHDQRQISFLQIAVMDPFNKFYDALIKTAKETLGHYESEVKKAAQSLAA